MTKRSSPADRCLSTRRRPPAKRRRSIWLFAALTLFIFFHSLQPADLSGQESGWILSLLLRLFPFLCLTDHMVRKAAHFTEFAVLGLLSEPLGQGPVHLPADAPDDMDGEAALSVPAAGFRPSRRTAVWFSLSLCAATALCDETIQLFVEGRSGQVSDVWLDIAGASFGIALALLLRRITARRAGRNRL